MSNQQKDTTPSVHPAASRGQEEVRSEAMLPTDGAAPDLEVAEEVAFDLQSDSARRIGAMPDDTAVSKPSEAVAQTLQGDASSEQPADAVKPNPQAPASH